MHPVLNFRRGALLAHDPDNLDAVPDLTEDERRYIEREKTHRWDQPFMMSAICLVDYAPR